MKENKNSPDKLKQTKITAFYSQPNNRPEGLSSQMNRKRKNSSEISEHHKTPVKRAAKFDSISPDIFQTSPKANPYTNACNKSFIENEMKNNFGNFVFDDFENDPLLGLRKKESPKKKILTENFSENETWTKEKSEIDFEAPVKCKIMKTTFLTRKHFEQILLLSEAEINNKRGICKLRDVWTSFSFSVGDNVCIQATYSEGHWVVDNKNGYIILHPDILVSSTTLTISMFCMRQGLFANLYKENNYENNHRLLFGRFIHELFQESLKTNSYSDEDLSKIISNFVQSRANLQAFFLNDVNISDVQKEMKDFIPHIKQFMDVYINKRAPPGSRSFDGTIEEVIDIEELIKSPTLGFKGRVDVTVKLRSKEEEKIAPLELKTGRATFSKDHKSQLILYILLMNELGRKVDSGLLLYLKEDIMEEILPGRDEIRNLILLRNHFVGFFKGLGSGHFPDPIRNVKGCTKCSYLRICTTYLRGGERDKLLQNSPLGSIEIPDVKPSHVDYFVKWNKVLWLEFEENFQGTTDECEISELMLEPNVESVKEEFKCTFRKPAKSKKRAFRPGIFVYIMNSKNNRICSGQIIEVTDFQISVLTNKELNDFSDIYKLIILKSKFLNFYLTNLGCFLNNEFESLRDLIIDKRAPSFDKNFDKTEFKEKCLQNLLHLNKDQQKAILKSLLCQDYLLIKGPPGTGKTHTIVTLIKILLALNKTVLIASHTHSAIDNILLRLDGVEYLRLGLLKSIHEDIHKNSFDFLIENCSSVDDIRILFNRKLVASTCMGISTDLIRKIKVEYCIVDESSQVLQPEILRPLFCCKKFILVGDENQLPPVVRNQEARKLGMAESMFEWLSNDAGTVTLRMQYRMNAVINSLANAIAYNGLIECGSERVAKATMKIINQEILAQEDEWIVDVLSNDLEKSVVFIDTSEYFRVKNTDLLEQRSSILEANIVVRLIISLIKIGLKKESIGVITPFWDQIRLLTTKLAEENLQQIQLDTVDQFQGRDKEVILFSCSKENQANTEVTDLEILNDKRRLTVAVTRAKHKLIIVGDRHTVSKYIPFQKLITSLSNSQFFYLSDGQKNFFWKDFLN